MNDVASVKSDLAATPVVLPVEAYVSPEYAAEEAEKLWSKVWQVACREEEIPAVGDYYTYDILDESVIVVRTAEDRIQAFYNVCQHRGRRLTEGCGHTRQFFCRFHGWRWDIGGENTFVLDPEDWSGALNPENLRLTAVKVGRWGGYVFVNFDPDCEPLETFLDPVPDWLDPFEIDKMRYRWRQWLVLNCNWKTAIEAFNEGYHTTATHSQLLKYSEVGTWSRAHGPHSVFGLTGDRRGRGAGPQVEDARTFVADMMAHYYDTVNAVTTRTILDAARRLVDVLPPDAPMDVALGKMMELAVEADAGRGVAWPKVDPEHFRRSGIDWHVFPNSVILHGLTHVLAYRARPNGHDPNSCIFEVYVLERFPEGGAPETEWVHQPNPTEEQWRLILSQDFQNMPEVQKGMKSRGFRGPRPNPVQEQAVINFHRALAQYMGRGAPAPLQPASAGSADATS
jgi:phenylpropionate dioxygenase-like ring-hydroxylating dioxygenase large terminal subunit